MGVFLLLILTAVALFLLLPTILHTKSNSLSPKFSGEVIYYPKSVNSVVLSSTNVPRDAFHFQC